MRGVRFILQLVLMLLRTVVYGWILALIDIVRRLVGTLKAFCAKKKLPHPFKNAAGSCLTVSHPAFRRPDPCIYSQSYLMKLGLPVTWDNPDIILRRNGVVVPEYGLLPGTQYEVEATVWNNSYDAPVHGMTVEFAFLSFGIGAALTTIGTTVVDVGVKGGPNHPAKTTIPWTTPAAPGHYCIQAKLDWVDDANQQNNLGQNNVDVALAQSPAHFSFVLRNPFAREHRFRLTVDTYTPLEPPDCTIAPFPRERRSQRIKRLVELHKASDFTVPAGWTVAITPDTVSLAPGAEATIDVDAEPPAGFNGEKAFNVNAFGDGVFAGGVTLVVRTP
jgi:hypothetical protein